MLPPALKRWAKKHCAYGADMKWTEGWSTPRRPPDNLNSRFPLGMTERKARARVTQPVISQIRTGRALLDSFHFQIDLNSFSPSKPEIEDTGADALAEESAQSRRMEWLYVPGDIDLRESWCAFCDALSAMH